MPSFTYIARDSGTGREIRSTVDASSEANAIAALLNRNLMVVSIQEKLGKKGKTVGGSVSLADIVIFTRQLATMVDAGLAMVQSLQALAEQSENKLMREVIKDITTRVEGGDSFSDALLKHPKIFNKLYVSMVAAGEKGGLLAEILSRLATYQENTARLRKKVKSAMMYPTAVTFVAISITIFLLVKVVPTFADIFSSMHGKLPAPTQYLINISNLLRENFIWAMLSAAAVVVGWLWYIKTPAGGSGMIAASSCRSLAASRTRFAWLDSRAPLHRWFAAACRFWKSSRSFKTRSATSSWNRPSRPPRPTSSAAKAFPPP